MSDKPIMELMPAGTRGRLEKLEMIADAANAHVSFFNILQKTGSMDPSQARIRTWLCWQNLVKALAALKAEGEGE